MYNKSKHPQVIYSLDSLSDSLFNLLENNSLEEITITEICSKINLSRKTFYRNCENVMDLVIYKIEKLIHNIQNNTEWESNDEYMLYNNFFNYWYNERKFLTILKEHHLFHLFINRFNVLIQDASYPFLENFLQEKENKNEIKLFYNAFIVGGLSHVLQQWTETHFNISIDELINALSVFIPEH